MNVSVVTSPWRYVKIENLLKQKHLKYVHNIFKKVPPDGRIIDINDSTLDKFAEKLFPELCIHLGVKETKIENILYEFKNLNSNVENLHVDQEWKYITVVCQLSQSGEGTSIYNSNKEYDHTVNWKFNQAVVFLQNKNHWHDVHSFTNANRLTMNIIYCIGNIPEHLI